MPLREKNIKDIFTEIYRTNAWGGTPGTFYSGVGTHQLKTFSYIKNLVGFIRSHEVNSILDIGCGDFRIMSGVLRQVDVEYIGIDIVDEMIQYHKKVYGGRKKQFIVLNAIDDELPKADMVTVRQVFQHLSNDQIQKILKKLSKYKYVLITEHILITASVIPNLDQAPGQHNRTKINSSIFIDRPPFNLTNAEILFEYRSDETIDTKTFPAVLRTYLVKNPI